MKLDYIRIVIISEIKNFTFSLVLCGPNEKIIEIDVELRINENRLVNLKSSFLN
jgi:hypothetical protein